MSQLKYWDGTAWVDAVIGAQGATGVQGPSGAGTQGIQGVQGVAGSGGGGGGGTSSYPMIAQVGDDKGSPAPYGPPTSGGVSWDAEPNTGAAVLYISSTDNTSPTPQNLNPIIGTWVVGNKLLFQSTTNAGNYQQWTITTAPVYSGSNYWTIGVTAVTSTYNFSNTNTLYLTQTAPAAQGIQGTAGSAGSDGAQGIQGLQGTEGTQGLGGLQGTQGPTGPATVPQNSQTSSYTVVAGDNGKYISTTSGGVTIATSTAMSVGDNFVIYNNSSSNITVTQGSGVTLRQAATTSTGNRTMANYALATVLCVASDTYIIAGTGLS